MARADIPPPPGITRVGYRFRVDAVLDGKTLIAYPTYNPKDNGSNTVILRAGVDQGTWQGYQPGIYSLKAADVASLPKDDAALQRFLASHAERCLKHVPRVFQVPTKTGVAQITDVIHVAIVAGKCQAWLAKTVYEGTDGKSAEGGIDATGKRTPPAPFGADLPPLGDAGFVLTAPPPVPTQRGGGTDK